MLKDHWLPVPHLRTKPTFSRRSFNKLAAVAALVPTALLSTAKGAEPTGAGADTQALLEGIVQKYAQVEDSAWLLIHAIRAMGKGVTIGGKNAVEYLCGNYLEENEVGGRSFLSMPIEHEGHPHCFLSEAVLDAGVSTDFSFQRNGRRWT